MPYPIQLLPQVYFKEIQEDISDLFVCRKISDKQKLEDIDEILPEELTGILRAQDALDYSTNLPGIFELDHNKIEIIGNNKAYFRRYWNFTTSVEIPIDNQDFFIDENKGWFFIPIKEIQNYPIPFNRIVNLPPNEIAYGYVVHTPTNCNFWHFSIRWRDENGFINTNDSKWKNPIIGRMRSLISECFTLFCQQQIIPEEWFVA